MYIYSANIGRIFDDYNESITINGNPFPMTYNGITYDKDNPLPITFRRYGAGSFSLRAISNVTFPDGVTQPLLFQTSASLSSIAYGAPTLIYTTEPIPRDYTPFFTRVETTTIQGKFRKKYSWGPTNVNSMILQGGTVQVNVKVDGTDLIGICFGTTGYFPLGQGITWSRLISNGISKSPYIYTEEQLQEYGKYTSVFGLRTPSTGTHTNVGFIRYCDFYDFSGEYFFENEFQNIDFGTEPQEVPVQFKNWFDREFDPIYENIYTIKSNDGATQYAQITDAAPVNKVLINVEGDIKNLILTGINNVEYTATWESPTPDGMSLVGMSTMIDTKRPEIPISTETSININSSSDLYEVYSMFKPITDAFTLYLYQNSAEASRVEKTDYLVEVGQLNGALRESTSITNMSVTIEMWSVPNFNYVYIPILSRYYFVTDIVSIKQGLWSISLTVDVLMTYRLGLYKCNAFVDKNENVYNPLIVDSEVPLQQGQDITVDFLQNDVIVLGQGQFVLTGFLVSERIETSAISEVSTESEYTEKIEVSEILEIEEDNQDV